MFPCHFFPLKSCQLFNYKSKNLQNSHIFYLLAFWRKIHIFAYKCEWTFISFHYSHKLLIPAANNKLLLITFVLYCLFLNIEHMYTVHRCTHNKRDICTSTFGVSSLHNVTQCHTQIVKLVCIHFSPSLFILTLFLILLLLFSHVKENALNLDVTT